MKKLIASALSLCIIGGFVPNVPRNVNAAGTVITNGNYGDNITYTVDDEGTLTISGTGMMEPHLPMGFIASPFPSTGVKRVVVNEGVSSLCNFAFCNFQSLEDVSLPETLVSMGERVFLDCQNLKTITLPDSLTYTSYGNFAGCTGLESVTLSESLKRISGGEFIGTNLSLIDIPESVEAIGYGAFGECPNLKSIKIRNPNCEITSSEGGARAISNGYYRSGESDEITYYYNGIICGYKNSTAQAYAEENGYNFVSFEDEQYYEDLGKINDDERITVIDATAVLRECAARANSKTILPEKKAFNADLDFDGRLSVVDATLLLRYCGYLNAPETTDKLSCFDWLAYIGKKPKKQTSIND
jgi:hypothetical protein